jgi:hypothetical protein
VNLRALAALAAFAAAPAHAESSGCDSPESHQLDFWIGEWDLSYTQDGKLAHSRNRITRILDGCAILEEFSGAPGTKLDGRSVSTFDRATSRWKQAWVDNSGSFLDFSGAFAEGRMIFGREFERGGKRIMQRMVFQDIRRDRLKWLWQRSDDGGGTWSTQWEIGYRRVK